MSSPLPILRDVRRTDTTLTLVSEWEGNREVMSCGLRGHVSSTGLSLYKLGYSLDNGVSIVLLHCHDVSGLPFYYSVQTDKLDTFLEHFQPAHHNLFRSVKYGDDHFTLEFLRADGVLDSFTVGVVKGRYDYTLREYGATWRDEDKDFTLCHYRLLRPNGNVALFEVLLTLDELPEFVAEQRAFLKAPREPFYPKIDAAVIPYVVQQAAYI